jgi:YD repeat-containing protein
VLRRVIVAVACALALWQPAPARADITYIYDRLGRLVGVVDPAGDTAVYRYDAVGNLLSISRHASTTVSIIDFSPDRGLVGTSVTIQGTGFSATPSQNTVTFNGTSAVATASTPTRITTTVPAGATTGTIAVSAPGGSATSAGAFTVLTTSEAPTITSFTPTIALAGTAVTVSGSNFVTAPVANNRLRLHRTHALPGTVTSTSIATTVPYGTTSGRLSIATPAGSAVSADDFFVPPPGFTVADVASTGRVTLGGSGVTATIPANKVGLVVFDGAAGQPITLGFSGMSITGLDLTVYRPEGGALTTKTINFFGGDMHIASLPVTGTYQLLLDPSGSYSGNVTVTLSQDLSVGPLVVGGSAVNATITRPGQRARTTFSGTAGQRLSLHSDSGSFIQLGVTVTRPDGTAFSSGGFVSLDGTAHWDPLPVTGTYTILVDPEYAQTLSFSLLLSEAVSATLSVGGASVPITIGRAGQRARVSFEGTSGQRLSLGLTSSTFSGASLAVLTPDGTTYAGPYAIGPSAAAVDLAPLPTTGTYVIQIDPSSTYTGGVTLTLSEEISGSIVAGGSPVGVSIPRAGQRARLTFSGTAGQRVSLKTTGVSIGQAAVSILRPDDSVQGGITAYYNSTGFLEPITLASTGTYKVLVDPTAASTGDLTVTLYDVPANPTGSVTINGAAFGLSLPVPGQTGDVSFPGTSGQALTIRGINSTIGCLTLTLYEAGGLSTGIYVCTASFTLNRTLASTGTHVIRVDPDTWNTGSVDISVTNP